MRYIITLLLGILAGTATTLTWKNTEIIKLKKAHAHEIREDRGRFYEDGKSIGYHYGYEDGQDSNNLHSA